MTLLLAPRTVDRTLASPDAGGSTVLIDEYWDRGDERFLAEVLASRSDKKLLSLAERWYWDPRPFARRALLAYVDDGCDRPQHRPLVKRLFKLAEAARDDELMGHFMVAFDRLVVHRLVERKRYDWQSRSVLAEWVLERDRTVRATAPKPKPGRGRRVAIDRFSQATRSYLCRRVWRYFRTLGHQDPARYRSAITAALLGYRDAQLERPEQLLDAWSLVNALYHDSPILLRKPRGVRLAPGALLADLAPAPSHPAAWREGFADLLSLLQHAASRTVRSFALVMLERDHADALRSLPSAEVRALLRCPHPEVQSFGAQRLRELAGLDNLPLAEWLELLRIQNAEVIPVVCELVRRHVHPDRLSREQAIALAASPVAAVAELGLDWLRAKPVAAAADLEALVALRGAESPPVRAAAMEWLAGLLRESRHTTPLMVRDLVDAKYPEVRSTGLELMEARFAEVIELWAALSESPYDDVRARFVRHLEVWQDILEPASLQRVWTTTLLAIHRGGRAKRLVVRQIAARIVASPEEAEALLPLLGIALRSVRAAERRAGLAAIARAAFRLPALHGAIDRALPELRLGALEGA